MSKKTNKNKPVKKAVNIEPSETAVVEENNSGSIFDNKFVFWGAFGLIILVSIALRLTLIDFPLWYDEGCSIAAAINTFPAGINNYLWTQDLQHTPLYFYILHFIMQFFGDSVVVLRASSLIVSMALLPVTYIVTEKLSSKKVALFAMLLMGINTFQVLYSIEIRMYPYVILLALLSVNYLIDYDRTSDRKALIKLGIVNLLNPYFLTGSIIFVLAQFIIYTSYLDWRKADSKKISDYVMSNLFVLLGYIPYIIIIVHYALVRSHFLVTDLSKFSAINFWGTIQNLVSCDPGHIHETRFEPFFNYLKGNTPEILHKNSVMQFQVWTLVFLPMIVFVGGIIRSLFDKEKLNQVVFGTIFLSLLAFVFLANARTIAFTGRYIIFIAPFIFILGAIGLSKFNKYVLISIILLYTIGCGYAFKITYPKYQFIAEYSLKSPADFIKKNGYNNKKNLVVMPFASSVSFYYFNGADMPRVLPLELFHAVRNPESTIIYDNDQREAFKTGDKYKVFQNIITSDKYISKNFMEFMDSYISSVPKGGYIIWVVYYSDNYAIIPPEQVKRVYGKMDNVIDYTMTGMLSKFDVDFVSMMMQKAQFVKKDRDESNQFFVFRKK